MYSEKIICIILDIVIFTINYLRFSSRQYLDFWICENVIVDWFSGSCVWKYADYILIF